ncbi:type II secretion system protein GspD [Flavobacterium sp. XS1P32]|uniref:type II secretion system protein GspD n=1 Tax=Flavobacterium sp. XS1P32 TaxID=3401726 RepID=UPI003AB1046B
MKTILSLFLLLTTQLFLGQENRIQQIKNNIEAISTSEPGLSEKININIKEASLASFLIAIAEVHKLNISVAPNLAQITIVNNFTDVIVGDLLVFLAKEYNLSIEFSGTILAIKSYEKPIEREIPKTIDVSYNNDLLSLNVKEDKLYDVFKKITEVSNKNLVFTPGLENKLLTSFIINMPFDAALDKLALASNLNVTKSKDNFYIFESYDLGSTTDNGMGKTKTNKNRKGNFFFNILDADKKLLEVDFENMPIANVIFDIGNALDIDLFVSSPMNNIGIATVKSKSITFDQLLNKLFEIKQETKSTPNNQPNQFNPTENNISTPTEGYTYKRNGNMYFFGTKNQLVVRNIKTIPLMHRSIDILGDPSKEGRSAGRIASTNNFSNFNSNNRINNDLQQQNNNFNSPDDSNTNSSYKKSESILSIVPEEITKELDIKVDKELNSFVVSGPAINIERFENFIKYIDKPVPVILIEVMLLEINKNTTIETGINAGIGDKPSTTAGTIYPTADIKLGAQTINKIIDGFNGFGSLNIGKVVPNFYLSLKAMESNGNLKIRSSPRLSTLNGHKAFLSIGETTYYVVTNQSFYGSQIPQASEIKNYQPIDAELSVTIMPLVSGDGQITMDIKVIQSSFNGQKVDKDAPPGINSREFTSIIRVKDQDIIVLGGLEESVKNDSGSGVPLLSRIPILKWLFSSRKKEESKKKLSVLIKPIVIY